MSKFLMKLIRDSLDRQQIYHYFSDDELTGQYTFNILVSPFPRKGEPLIFVTLTEESTALEISRWLR